MNYKLLFVALAGAAMVPVQASYELGFVLANSTIYRYDMNTGASLATFATRHISYDIAVDAVQGIIYSLGTDANNKYSLHRYNYSTGEYISQTSFGFNLAGSVHNMNWGAPGELLISGTDGVRRVNPSTGAQVGVLLKYTGFTHSGGAVYMASNYAYYLASDSDGSWFNDYVIGVDANNSWVGNYQFAGAIANNAFSDISIIGNRVFTNQSNVGAFGNISVLDRVGQTSSLGLTYGPAAFSDFQNAFTRFGHNDGMYNLYNLSGNWFSAPGTANPLSWGSTSFQLSGLNNKIVDDFEIAVAPEPGTYLALAAGLAILGRRRKRAN